MEIRWKDDRIKREMRWRKRRQRYGATDTEAKEEMCKRKEGKKHGGERRMKVRVKEPVIKR